MNFEERQGHMLVTGPKVDRDLAKEIICRNNHLYRNMPYLRYILKQIAAQLGYKYSEIDNELLKSLYRQIGIVSNTYISNEVGEGVGWYSWCHTDGTIYYWGLRYLPKDSQGLYKEWNRIARAFPSLELYSSVYLEGVSVDVKNQQGFTYIIKNGICTEYLLHEAPVPKIHCIHERRSLIYPKYSIDDTISYAIKTCQTA